MNNPRAFPHPEFWNNPGLTMRDYFAAAAMQGILAHEGSMRNADNAAAEAYLYADAMLARR